MKTELNITIDPGLIELIVTALQTTELASLFRALTAVMTGQDPSQHLNTAGLKLAYTLLMKSVDKSIKRRAINRANGAKGGRPRKHDQSMTSPSPLDTETSELVLTKKSKKEDLSPTPPIEEKNKKNNIITLSPRACEEESDQSGQEAVDAPLRITWEPSQPIPLHCLFTSSSSHPKSMLPAPPPVTKQRQELLPREPVKIAPIS